MTVSVTWSLTNGGAAISSPLDIGNLSNGESSTSQEVFLRHNGVNPITNVGLYIRAYSGSYSGGATAIADLAEVISWGDATDTDEFGGVEFNLLATTDYPSSGWPIVTNKSPTGGFVCRTEVGDEEANAFTVPDTTGAISDGTIQVSSAPYVRFKIKITIPVDEDTVGLRQFDIVCRYTYTT